MRAGVAAAATVALVLGVWLGRSIWGGAFVLDHSTSVDVFHLSTLYDVWGGHLRSGQVPLWFPEFQTGYPVASAWMYGLFYPGLLLFAWLPADLAWSWTALLHMVFGAVGMYRLSRSDHGDAVAAATAAVAFGLCEFLTGKVLCGHLNLILPAVWAPWVLLHVRGCVRGSRGANGSPGSTGSLSSAGWLGLCLGLGLLSGHVQLWFYVLPLVLAFAAAEVAATEHRGPAVRRLLIGVVIGGSIAALQAFSALDLLTQSHPEPIDRLGLTQTAAPLQALAAKAFPGALGWFANDGWFGLAPAWGAGPEADLRYFEHELFGIAGLFLVPLVFLGARERARGRWFWIVVVLLGLLLSLGGHFDLTYFPYQVPPLSTARTPGRVLLLVAIAVPLLVGRGVAVLGRRRDEPLWTVLRVPLLVTVGTGLVAGGVLAWWYFGQPARVQLGYTPVPRSTALDRMLVPAVVAAVFATGVVLGACVLARRGGRWWLALPGSIALAALVSGLPPLTTVDSSFYFRDWASAVPAQARDHRMLYLAWNRFPNLERQGVRTLKQMCHVEPPAARAFLHGLNDATLPWIDVAGLVHEPPYDPLLEGTFLPQDQRIDLAPTPLPYALFKSAEYATDAVALERMQAGDGTLFLSAPATLPSAPDQPGVVPAVVPAAQGDLHARAFRVATPASAWFFVSHRHMGGWEAQVDGEVVPLTRAAVMFCAVPVPSGEHDVRLVYRPWWRVPGWMLMIGGLLAGVSLVLVARRRARESAPPAPTSGDA